MGLPLHSCFLLRLLLRLLVLRLITASSSSSTPASEPVYCGGVEIPYPFELINGTQARSGKRFDVQCDHIHPLPKLLVGDGAALQIFNISLEEGFVSVGAGPIAELCEGHPSPDGGTESSSWIDLMGTPFTFSHTMNNFTVIGCDALAMIQVPNYTSGCVAFCDAAADVPGQQSCSGIGCCQSLLPPGLQRFNLKLHSVLGGAGAGNASSLCSKAFLTQRDQFDFSSAAINMRKLQNRRLVLDWVIGLGTCEEPDASTGNACQKNARCYNASAGVGYRCRCEEGYSGNPYLPEGCQDIDECIDPKMNDCIGECTNTPGGFECACPKGMIGDGRKNGHGCMKSKELPKVIIGVGAGIFCVLVLLGSFWPYWLLQRRRQLTKLKETFFRQNGGLLLQRQIASQKGSNGGTKIFTAEEIEKATSNFNESRILGRGGQGTVYKGMLPNRRIVAIKKSRISDETQIEQFINEVIILTQVNHKNVVKLLGCCLETQVPLLVYEFVPNGTLFDHIHSEKHLASQLTWEHRLRIAAETAGALAYLHSTSSFPIIHRDVKTTNILLDKSLMAKVSDFGASRSVPFDKTHITTLVQGTLGYLDPEYFQTSQLTEKSDVYSFGVVLVELLTREKPVSSSRPEGERNLALHFITSLEKKRLPLILEAELIQEVGIEHLSIIARLAVRCLSLKGEERPSMKEVAMELQWAWRYLMKHANMKQILD